MLAYDYKLKYRPPTATRLPEGWDLVEIGIYNENCRRTDIPIGKSKFGVVRYRRRLSQEEIESYELELV